MTDQDFEHIIQMITRYTGIVPKDSHREGIRHYVENRVAALAGQGISYDDYVEAYPAEIEHLINEATVNETYFFREENQFALIKNKLFPELRITSGGSVNIWSAACSSGEEIYSLALLAKEVHLVAECTASDINTAVLEKCREGVYGKNSMRTVDGAAFRYLLEPYKKEDSLIHIDEEIISKINIVPLNLSKLADASYDIKDFPKNQHLVFVRNVFIYFTREMKAKILERIVKECMAPGGYLFVSTNEIAGFDPGIVPAELKKYSDGSVFYFRKEEL